MLRQELHKLDRIQTFGELPIGALFNGNGYKGKVKIGPNTAMPIEASDSPGDSLYRAHHGQWSHETFEAEDPIVPTVMVQLVLVNDTKEAQFGDDRVIYDIFGLFGRLQAEYGRCISKLHHDTKNGGVRESGWVFERQARYSDCNETYIQHTWADVVINLAYALLLDRVNGQG